MIKNDKSKKNSKWQCISNCGACCKLDPLERLEAIEVLSKDQLDEYLGLVGKDGWCRHYDTNSHKCKIYADRPDFCRVSEITNIFNVEATNANCFAIACCKQQIKAIYGGRSKVYRKFVRQLVITEADE